MKGFIEGNQHTELHLEATWQPMQLMEQWGHISIGWHTYYCHILDHSQLLNGFQGQPHVECVAIVQSWGQEDIGGCLKVSVCYLCSDSSFGNLILETVTYSKSCFAQIWRVDWMLSRGSRWITSFSYIWAVTMQSNTRWQSKELPVSFCCHLVILKTKKGPWCIQCYQKDELVLLHIL